MYIEGKLCNWMKVVVGGGVGRGRAAYRGSSQVSPQRCIENKHPTGSLGFRNIMEGTGSDFSVELTEGKCRKHVNTTVDFMYHISLWKTP